MDFEARDIIDIEDEEQIIEGGNITGISRNRYKVDPLKKHWAVTARTLAYVLVAILPLSFFVHYGVTVWLVVSDKVDAIEKLNGTYTTWLPVISGLAGSAVTYYFTKEK